MCPNMYISYFIGNIIHSYWGCYCVALLGYTKTHLGFPSSYFIFVRFLLRFLVSFFPFGPGSSVGIENRYGLDSPGIEFPVGARFSAPVQTGPGAQTASCSMSSGSFLGGKERPESDADPSPPSNAVVKKE